jgi:hypothetical protein
LAICGPSAAGLMPASRLITSALRSSAWFIPCTHWTGLPWLGQSMKFMPTSPEISFMPSWIVCTNGIELDAGMLSSVLPAATLRASNAGPGGWNEGTARYFSICALACSTPAFAWAEAGAAAAPPPPSSSPPQAARASAAIASGAHSEALRVGTTEFLPHL